MNQRKSAVAFSLSRTVHTYMVVNVRWILYDALNYIQPQIKSKSTYYQITLIDINHAHSYGLWLVSICVHDCPKKNIGGRKPDTLRRFRIFPFKDGESVSVWYNLIRIEQESCLIGVHVGINLKKPCWT